MVGVYEWVQFDATLGCGKLKLWLTSKQSG